MPVTTKAQRSAESGESENSVKPRMGEFLSKIKKSAKSRDNLNSLLFLPAEPDWTKVAGSNSGGLLFLPSGVGNSKNIKRLAERSLEGSILPGRVRTHRRAAGSSRVFPSVGTPNPTLTIAAPALMASAAILKS